MAVQFLTGRAVTKGLSMASKYFKKKKTKKEEKKKEYDPYEDQTNIDEGKGQYDLPKD